MADFAALAGAVESLGAELVEQNRKIGAQNELITKQNEQLKKFVPRRRFRWLVAGIVVAAIVLFGIGWKFRVSDQTRLRDRDAQQAQTAISQHQTLVAGCERSNDQRAALRRVIERAYTPTPIPDGLPPELRDLVEQSQQRQASQREEQLKDPGVQPVDCAQAFPAPPPPSARGEE
jgi:hypothetical protein